MEGGRLARERYTFASMYTISVERTICAAHALEISGSRETLHGHNWRVQVALGGGSLDGDGLLVDFHAMEAALAQVLEPFSNKNFNDVPPFDRINPTAELIAQFVAISMGQHTPRGVRVLSATVSEAPGCTATYANPFGGGGST